MIVRERKKTGLATKFHFNNANKSINKRSVNTFSAQILRYVIFYMFSA